MKRSKHTFRAHQRRRFLPLIAVGILALLGIGGAIAYYSDSTIFANIFHLNHYEAEYVETFESPENWKTCDEVPKTVITTNNSTAPFKVRLSYEEYWRNKEDNANLPLQKDGETLAIINFQNEDDWTLEGNWYYYKQDLQPGESTTSLFKSVTLNCQSNLATNNVCYETENGTVCETPEDDYENAKYHLNITVQTSSEEFSHDNEYYTLTVNPNGGTYKGSSDVYSERILWGTTVDLGSIAYADHELVNWTKNENETHTGTTIRITSDTTLKANWQSSLFHNVTVNPNGGTLAGKTEPIVTSVRQGTDYTLTNEEPTREGYLFDGWQLADESMVTNHTFTVIGDITITAKWSLIVAKNERTGTFYRSITAAETEALNGDTITLLVDTVEHFTNTKEITLNLGTHTITGSITNNGTLTLLDGEVNNPDGVAVTNNGTFTMGINDFKDNNTVRILPNYVRIIGTTTGLKQNGHFYFYDGFIEGEVGLEGGYDGAPFYRNTFDDTIVYYFPLVDHNWEKDCQHVELAGSDNAVTKTKIGGDIYYYNLQDNINTSARTGYKIYAVRNFDASYAITSAEGTDVVFDICGYNITINDTITINGKLTIEDSETTVSTVNVADNSIAMPSVNNNVFVTPHADNTTTTITYGGIISVPQTIINHGNFVINNARITGTTANDTIKNYATLTMNGGALGATTGYVMRPIANETYRLDKNSYIYMTVSSKVPVYSTLADFIWDGGGNIYSEYYGIQVGSGSATIKSGVVYGKSTGVYGQATLNGGTIKSSNIGMSGVATVSGGKVIVTGTGTVYGLRQSSSGNALTLNSGEIIVTSTTTSSNDAFGMYSTGKMTINNGSIVVNNNKGPATGAYGAYTTWPFYYGTVEMNGGTVTTHSVDNTANGLMGSQYNGGTQGVVTVNNGVVAASSDNGNSYGIRSPNVTVRSGKITGEDTYGIYINDGGIGTIGENDGEISITNPEIIGGKYGIYNGSVSYYDGVLRGGIEAYQDGAIKSVADDSTVFIETTTIDGKEYKSSHLINEYDVAKIGETKYKKLSDAIAAANTGDIIDLIADNYMFYSLTITDEKEITIRTNGYSIYTGNPISNYGKTTIINNSTTSAPVFTFTGTGYYLTNSSEAELTLKNIKISAVYGIQNDGTLSSDNLQIASSNTAIKNTGTLTATNVQSITGDTYAIYNDGGVASYTGGTIGGDIYNNSGELNLTGNYATKTSRELYYFITNNGTMQLNSFQALFANEFIKSSSNSSSGYSRTIYNTGVLNTSNNTAVKQIAGTPDETFWHNIVALYNDGGTVTSSDTLYEVNGITSKSRRTNTCSYGIYNTTGTVTLTTGSVLVRDFVSSYSIWNDSGTVTIGTPEPQNSPNYGRDTADVSITNPSITAISTNSSYTGIGVKNNTGKIYYYDGKVTGSSAAMPEKPAGIEYLYEPKDYVDEETGYHYRVLEWMREQAGN